MRKVLDWTALLITIISGVVAIIIFFSGQGSFRSLISGSTAPTTPSLSHTSTSTLSKRPVSFNTPDGMKIDPWTVLKKSSLFGVETCLYLFLTGTSFFMSLPMKHVYSLDIFSLDRLKGFLVLMSFLFAPFVTSYVVYDLLATIMVTSQVALILYTNAIVFPVCWLSAYAIRKWMLTLQ